MRLGVVATAAASFALFAAANSAMAGTDPAKGYYAPDNHGDAAPVNPRRNPRRAPYCCGVYRFVYAESWYGFKKVVAPVRRAALGDQVRLPGGAWVYCEFSCEYTLRKQSLDFWQGVTGQGENISPGYFRWDFYIDDFGRPHRY